MSTIGTNSEDLILNADGSGSDIKFKSNGTEVGSISDGGVMTATSFAGSGASLTSLPAANLTGTLPAISGASLTAINASNLGSGTVPSARLGSGTASSSTFLRGDSTYAEAGGGKVVQMNSMSTGSSNFNNSHGVVTLDSLSFTSAHTSGNGIFIGYPLQTYIASANTNDCSMYFRVYDGSTQVDYQGRVYFSSGAVGYNNMYMTCHFPAITSTATLTVKITAESGSTTTSINTQENARAFFIQEISS